MSGARLIDRIDDGINPIVVRELRQAVKSRLVIYGLLIFLLLQLGVLGIALMNRAVRSAGMDFTAGREAFQALQTILVGSCLIFVPLYAGIRLAWERSDSNVDLLFISTLRPRKIISGKFLAAGVLTLLIFSACAPFMTFCYLLRGLDIPTILLILGINFVSVLLATQAALLLAVLPLGLILKSLFGLAALIPLWGLLYFVVEISEELLRGPRYLYGDRWEFWAAWGSGAAATLVLTGLLFVCAVALVSPASANRAPPVRLYVLAAVLATCPLAWYWVEKISHPGPMLIWLLLSGSSACVYLLIAVCERDHWGPRVAKAIPRTRVLRWLAFLIYSGAAGGVFFASLLFGFVTVMFLAATDGKPSPHASDVRSFLWIMLSVFLFTFNYAILAAMIRFWFLGRWLQPIYNWLVALILVGVGTTLPAALAFIIHQHEMHNYHWWMLPNPFASILEIPSRHYSARIHPFVEMCLSFLAAWSAVTLLMALPWFLGQIRRFRPPARSTIERVPAAPPVAESPAAAPTVVGEASIAARH